MPDNNEKDKPPYIPYIGIPEKNAFRDRTYTRAIYHRATAPGFFGVIILCFFMSFINIKCGGRIVSSYSGIDIIRGKDHGKQAAHGANEIIPVRQSAYHQMEKAKKEFTWKRQLKEDYETHVDDAPYDENDFSAMDDFNKAPTNFSDTTKDPFLTRLCVTLALACAIVGLIVCILKGMWTTYVQIVVGFAGFIAMLLLERLIKLTVPTPANKNAPLFTEYSAPVITTELALGYWMVLFLFLAVAVVGIMKARYFKKWKDTKTQ